MNGYLMKPSGYIYRLYFKFSFVFLIIFAVLKEVNEGLIISRSRSYHNLQVAPTLADPFNEAKQNIIINGSLMDIVQNYY